MRYYSEQNIPPVGKHVGKNGEISLNVGIAFDGHWRHAAINISFLFSYESHKWVSMNTAVSPAYVSCMMGVYNLPALSFLISFHARYMMF